MSVTQDYKENNLLTFTLTKAEVSALRVAACEVGISSLDDSIVMRKVGDTAEAEFSQKLSMHLLTAFDKLGRKS